jgi:hypothetical protein
MFVQHLWNKIRLARFGNTVAYWVYQILDSQKYFCRGQPILAVNPGADPSTEQDDSDAGPNVLKNFFSQLSNGQNKLECLSPA